MERSRVEITDPTLANVWSRVRDELARLQDLAKGEESGQVVNPISGSVYSQNTACAALVFATEYIMSGAPEWLRRAQSALEGLKTLDAYSGLAEPKWNRLGWHYNRGSLFTTGTFCDALWRTQSLLNSEKSGEELLPLLRYLKTCTISAGSYSHDSVKAGHLPSSVQNVAAIALFLMEAIAQQMGSSDDDLRKEVLATSRALVRGQRRDGLWPYVVPDARQKFAFRYPIVRSLVSYIPIVRRFFLVGGDSSIFFGDAVHHCLVLYYMAKSLGVNRQPQRSPVEAVKRGWHWIEQHLVETDCGGTRFDFDWEPTPSEFRYANFRDTSTYFLILATLPLLVELGLATNRDAHRISKGILVHIERNLLQSGESATSIKPYEGPDSVLKWILPRVGEASAWKGALLAEFVLGLRNPIA